MPPEIAALCRAVADRYGGVLADVLRLALPPRHARVEAERPRAASVSALATGAAPAVEVRAEAEAHPAGGDVPAATGGGVLDTADPAEAAEPAPWPGAGRLARWGTRCSRGGWRRGVDGAQRRGAEAAWCRGADGGS